MKEFTDSLKKEIGRRLTRTVSSYKGADTVNEKLDIIMATLSLVAAASIAEDRDSRRLMNQSSNILKIGDQEDQNEV